MESFNSDAYEKEHVGDPPCHRIDNLEHRSYKLSAKLLAETPQAQVSNRRGSNLGDLRQTIGSYCARHHYGNLIDAFKHKVTTRYKVPHLE